MQGPSQRGAVRFGVFDVDTRAGEIRKSGVKLKLQEQPFRVLEVLLEQPGQVVAREELQQRLWPNDTFVDFDNSLNTAVNKLREVLNDSASSPRFVETVPRRGYRFVAPVERWKEPAEVQREAAPEQARQTLRFLWIAVVTLSVLLTLALLGLFPARREQTEPLVEAPLRRFSYQPEEIADSPSISPNGRHIVYTTGAGSQAKLWVRDLDQNEPRIIQGAAGAGGPFWSPDSRFIGFFAENELRKISLAGGDAQVVCRLPGDKEPLGASWSPSDEAIVFAQLPHIYEVPASGGLPRLLIEAEEGSSIEHVEQPHLLAAANGGKAILFSFKERGGFHFIAVQSLETNERRVLARGAFGPAYSPSGHVLYTTIHDEILFIEALPFSLETMQPTGDPFVITTEGSNPSAAADGTLSYLEDGRAKAPYQLVWRNRGGTKIGEINPPVKWFSSFSMSLNGDSIAFAPWAGRLVIYYAKQDVTTRLPFGLKTWSPVLAPSGDKVAFVGYRDGNFGIFVQPLQGDLIQDPAVSTTFEETPNDWSRDGRFLAYGVARPKTGQDIWYLQQKQDGTYESFPFRQTPFDEQRAAFSPDGGFVAYSSNESGTREVYVESFPQGGSRIQVSNQGGDYPRWNPSGKELFYISGEMLVAASLEIGPRVSRLSSKQLFNYVQKAGSPIYTRYQVSEDGERFLLDEPLGSAPNPSIRVVQNWFAEFHQQD